MAHTKYAPYHDSLKNTDHAACGAGMTINLSRQADRKIVEDGLQRAAGLRYRSGYNPATGESDGAGLRFYGLPTAFYQKQINNSKFLDEQQQPVNATLEDKKFSIGHYFFPTDGAEQYKAKALITESAKRYGLRVAGWRNLDDSHATNKDAISKAALKKKPALWEAILLPEKEPALSDLETSTLKATAHAINAIRDGKLDATIMSQSSESVVYKGMILPEKLGAFYKDLSDPLFTASAVQIHTRQATNTSPLWRNAQPCVFALAHNGEFNSRLTNSFDMQAEKAMHPEGIDPNLALSDSIQFDAHLANLVLQGKELDEAFVQLMRVPYAEDYDPSIQPLLQFLELQTVPYNGPAFMVVGYKGDFMIRLDDVGLRPSRIGLVENAQGNKTLHAYNDNDLTCPEGGKIIFQKSLAPGGILMVTKEGEILETKEVLERIAGRYTQNGKNLKQALETHLIPVSPDMPIKELPATSSGQKDFSLEQILLSNYWDHETLEHVLRPLALTGAERIGAMGNDTSLLPSNNVPLHLSYFFHQLFAQVSAPPIDSIKERDAFHLTTYLGAHMATNAGKQLCLESPILEPSQLASIETQKDVVTHVLDMTFPFSKNASNADIATHMREHIVRLIKQADEAAAKGGIIILSNRTVSSDRASLPDMIAIAAVRKHLEAKQLIRRVSIVADSYQIAGPHEAAALIALGASAVYPRGAYEKISDLTANDPQFTNKPLSEHCTTYRHGIEKSLLKIMGKVGITDIRNYSNGQLLATLGLDLSTGADTPIDEAPSLANIFKGLYAPLKGISLDHIAASVALRHEHAIDNPHLTALPHFGHLLPESGGIDHGYSPTVVNAFTHWLKEEHTQNIKWRLHQILEKKGISFLTQMELENLCADKGFLDPSKKIDEFYPSDYLDSFRMSEAFKRYVKTVTTYQTEHPTSLSDHLTFTDTCTRLPIDLKNVESQHDIRARFFSGSMSQGALTVANPDTPDRLGAHETIIRGMNAIGANSGAGEGGENIDDLESLLRTARSKQIASGRFGVSAQQVMNATEVEIKVAQGAKPGEGGQLEGSKISIRFAAQRGSIPGVSLISPPPHHDIYSIEDLQQLIYDIKSVNPDVKISVKLVSAPGIGSIAVGVAKAGADVINVAGNSGGTAAAMVSSIKHAGMPAELGVAEVDGALRMAGLRDRIQIRTSGGFKTPEDIIKAVMLGADLVELGTTSMLAVGCKMQRTCNKSCEPGVATNVEKFEGQQIDVERYYVNLAAGVQEWLASHGFRSLNEIRGHTELLTCLHPNIAKQFDLQEALFNRNVLTPDLIEKPEEKTLRIEEKYIPEIKQAFKKGNIFNSPSPVHLTTQDRAFGARIAGEFYSELDHDPNKQLVLHTKGNAGQSYGAFNAGATLHHAGTVQDGAGKSMSSGIITISTPREWTEANPDYTPNKQIIGGNALFYGASGGHAYVNGQVGHRFGILMKGAQVVVEGTGMYAFEYMTSGTGMILGKTGRGVGNGASGGILFVYEADEKCISDSLRPASVEEKGAYLNAIKDMVTFHRDHTNSEQAKSILNELKQGTNKFSVLIPKTLDTITTLASLTDIVKTYNIRKTPICCGMRIWLGLKAKEVLETDSTLTPVLLQDFLKALAIKQLVSPDLYPLLQKMAQERLDAFKAPKEPLQDIEDLRLPPLVNFRPIDTLSSSSKSSSVSALIPELQSIMDTVKVYSVALSTDAASCSGCFAQSCAGVEVDTGCPEEKPINSINATLQKLGNLEGTSYLTPQQWTILRKAFELQIKKTPFIAYTGAACPAPCEDACTETIPKPGKKDPKRGGKVTGNAVPIKNIEYALFQLGRRMGWLDNTPKLWNQDEMLALFGTKEQKLSYDKKMEKFTPPFQKSALYPRADKEIVLIGSGPAAMQIAYEALRDGVKVRMYERSDRPGGLLADGIPADKFNKIYIQEDFERLKAMGLELHLNSEVTYDQQKQAFLVGETVIANGNMPNQQVVLCVGAGTPRTLDEKLTSNLGPEEKKKIIQAVDFLKACNDIEASIKADPSINREELITKHLGDMDPRGKEIVVIGGGDTAFDAVHWIEHYNLEVHSSAPSPKKENMTPSSLSSASSSTAPYKDVLVSSRTPRPASTRREGADIFPFPTRNGKKEYLFTVSENLEAQYHTVPVSISHTPDSSKLTITIEEKTFEHYDAIKADESAKKYFNQLPRSEKKEINLATSEKKADLVICAMGFEGRKSIPLIQDTKSLPNVWVAGDASGVGSAIIVGAQKNASDTYRNKIAEEWRITPNAPSTYKTMVRSNPVFEQTLVGVSV